MAITLDDVRYLQNQTDNNAKSDRREVVDSVGVGVLGRNDFDVTFASGLTVNVAGGQAYVRGLSTAQQGMYRCYLASAGTVTLAANGSSNPRIDQICLIVQDSNEDAGANNRAIVDVIQGTASSGATLDNRNGAANLFTQTSPTIIRLADVIINPGNSPALGSGGIRDRRPYAIRGVVPPIATDVDMVTFEPMAGINKGFVVIDGADHATCQAAALMYLPRRIAATRLRWAYQQDHTNVISSGQSYRFQICDASGRYIMRTSVVNFQGAVDALVEEVLTFTFNTADGYNTGYVFEAGAYYVTFGLSSVGAGNTIRTIAADCSIAGSGIHFPMTVNQYFRNGAGGAGGNGTTLPDTILGMADVASLSAPVSANIPVPIPSLSVG